MDRRLGAAVLDIFRDTVSCHGVEFSRLKQSSWEKTYRWLDTSGMALYLLDRIVRSGREGTVPAEALLRLQQNQRDNRIRTEQLFDEFVEINTAFQVAGMRYVNLKGITLVPDYCADPVLRFQIDLDFLIEFQDALRCREILCRLGYRLSGVNGGTWEFKAGGNRIPTLPDMYKPKLQRSVEIHFTADTPERQGSVDHRLSRAQLQTWRGFGFLSLCQSDKFLAQAVHLFRHLRGEWTRLAWVLEYSNFIRARRADDAFWSQVREQAETRDTTAAIAIGMASRIAAKAFGECEVPALDSWTVDVLPKHFKLWIERYANDVLLADFPGSKLYLLLDEQDNARRLPHTSMLKKLLPLRLPAPVVSTASTPFRARWNGWYEELKYFCFRLRFHIVAGGRYLLEAPRWMRAVVNLQG